MDENHPVFQSLAAKLSNLRVQYEQQPNEQNRYRMVRVEQLIAQWAPSSILAG